MVSVLSGLAERPRPVKQVQRSADSTASDELQNWFQAAHAASTSEAAIAGDGIPSVSQGGNGKVWQGCVRHTVAV